MRRTARHKASVDRGASWISYSDMMAALILVFVLILCYSMYQYFTMLDTKTAELDEKGALRRKPRCRPSRPLCRIRKPHCRPSGKP